MFPGLDTRILGDPSDLSHSPIQLVDGLQRTPMRKQTPKEKVPSIVEPTMQSVWLVRDTQVFGTKGETSGEDRSMELRLTYGEWLAIYFDALGLDKNTYSNWTTNKASSFQKGVITLVTEFDEDISEFPILSRIRSPFRDVVFELNEVEDLRAECLRVKARTSNSEALRGIEKLLHVENLARQLGLSIYLVSN